jgi:hypothetical protein
MVKVSPSSNTSLNKEVFKRPWTEGWHSLTSRTQHNVWLTIGAHKCLVNRCIPLMNCTDWY